MNWIEITATVFGALCVWLTVRQNILCWPTGLVQVLLYIIVFYQVRLYSDMLLHVIYVFLQLYGWYAWLYGGTERSRMPVSLLPQKTFLTWITVALVGTITLGFVMRVGQNIRFASLQFTESYVLFHLRPKNDMRHNNWRRLCTLNRVGFSSLFLSIILCVVWLFLWLPPTPLDFVWFFWHACGVYGRVRCSPS
jgi:hypothetical protein